MLAVALSLFWFALFSAVAGAQSLSEMAGQMIIVGFQGDNARETADLAKMIGEGRVGGVMYLKTNVSSLDSVRAMNAQFRSAGSAFPPFIALDQEGGSIERLTKDVGFKEIASAAALAKAGDLDRAEVVYSEMAKSLSALGYNLNFGPVADVNVNPDNPIIARYGRSYGADPAVVSEYASAFVRAHRNAHVLTALKHFPGHGSSAGDSHDGFVDVTKVWLPEELNPYRTLVAGGLVDMVMVAHLFHQKFSTEPGVDLPSSLSPSWIAGVLRHQIGFAGVVITDDLEMGAIREHFGFKDAIVRAVRAGADILLYSNTAKYRPGLADEVRAVLVEEARKDPAFAARVAESYQRIVALKQGIN